METMPPAQIEGLYMMSMDDYEKTYPYTAPPAKMTPLTSPINSARSDAFNTKCQAKGLTPYFTYVEPSKGCFDAIVHINNQPLDRVGPYASKKAAKEAACMAAMTKLDVFPDKAQLRRAEQQRSIPVTHSLDNNTGEHASKVNMICQQKGCVSNITYEEPYKSCFSATLTIDDEVIVKVDSFANKRDAKEELCRIAYPRLLEIGSRRKRKSLHAQDELPDASEALKEENWVGTLAEHCQHSKIEHPVYSETCVHPSQGPFSCAVHFAGSPPSGFGSTAGPFKKKTEAKKNAAMEAVLWLRHESQLAGTATTKRRRSSHDSQTALAEHVTGLTPEFSDAMDINSDLGDLAAPTASIGKQVQDLCFRLGFQSPTFELVPLPGSFYNVHATFAPRDVHREPRLSGALAPVHNVHGKKTAKDQCWRALLTVLEGIVQTRAS